MLKRICRLTMNIIVFYKRLIALVFLLFTVASVSSQSEIGWIGGTVFEFGEIHEADGEIRHCFRFRNNGEEPFSIIRISTSCGCTNVDYTRTLIEPGDTAKIDVTFNPAGRDGKFRSRLAVYTDSPDGMNSLFLKGYVIPLEKPDSALVQE